MRSFKLTHLVGYVALLLVLVTIGIGPKLSSKQSAKAPSKKVATVVAEKPITIVIPSYNNSAYCKKNLDSVLSQHYHNFRVIYIDDCSNDDTFTKVQSIIEGSPLKNRCTLIRNEHNKGALANIYDAVQSCPDEEIVVTVDGDDFLAHEGVLDRLNQIYSGKDVWMTYGSFLDYPSYSQYPVKCEAIPQNLITKNKIRKHPWVSSHLRTFYAGLFKKIQLHDLLHQGKFYPMGWDLAMMLPMLEMAGDRAEFVEDILYLYNRQNPISDHIVNFNKQSTCADLIRNATPYTRLANLKALEENTAVDLVIFSYHRPLQLYALLESVQTYLKPLKKISVIYRSDSEEFTQGYKIVEKTFPHVAFIKQSSQPHKDFQENVMKAALDLQYSDSSYVLFAVDDQIMKEEVDLGACVDAMRRTHAYGFYLSHGKNLDYCYMLSQDQPLPSLHTVAPGINAWQFAEGKADWNYPNSVDLVLYRKSEIRPDFEKIQFHNPNTLESAWNLRAKMKKVGLCFDHTKCINIPMNLVNISTNRHNEAFTPKELLNKFDEGYKINVAEFDHMENRSRHIDAIPTFVKR